MRTVALQVSASKTKTSPGSVAPLETYTVWVASSTARSSSKALVPKLTVGAVATQPATSAAWQVRVLIIDTVPPKRLTT